jgi:hypothetical protein
MSHREPLDRHDQDGDPPHDDVRGRLRALRIDPEASSEDARQDAREDAHQDAREDAPEAGTPEARVRAELHRRLLASGPPRPASLLERWRAISRLLPDLRPAAVGVLAGATTFALLVALRPAGTPRGSDARIQHAAENGAARRAAEETVHRIPADKVAVIRLNFTADVAIADVRFEVRLPDGLSFWSGGKPLAERSFRWRGDLAAGDNPLPIAVRGRWPGRYRVVATANLGARQIEHAVVLEMTGA